MEYRLLQQQVMLSNRWNEAQLNGPYNCLSAFSNNIIKHIILQWSARISLVERGPICLTFEFKAAIVVPEGVRSPMIVAEVGSYKLHP